MTKAEGFIEWVIKTDPDFKQRDHEEIITEFDPKAGFELLWGNMDSIYLDVTTALFSDGSTLKFNYKGEVIE